MPQYAQTPYAPPPTVPQPVNVASPPRKSALLVLGSILRMIGVIIGGSALIWVGILISDPTGLVNPSNPFSAFSTIGTIIILAAVGSILTGVGWSMQTWGAGVVVLSYDR